MGFKMKVVVTIPAYNEERNIGKVIKDIHRALKGWKKYQIVVVDDGSTDKTSSIANQLGALVVKHPRNYGLAETYRTEMKKCLDLQADVIVHIDADAQYPAEDIPRQILYYFLLCLIKIRSIHEDIPVPPVL